MKKIDFDVSAEEEEQQQLQRQQQQQQQQHQQRKNKKGVNVNVGPPRLFISWRQFWKEAEEEPFFKRKLKQLVPSSHHDQLP